MNLILLTVDCLRADRMGYMGYHKQITPNLDRLANEGVVFSQAISAAPWTAGSFSAILTSTYPLMYGGTVYLTNGRTSVAEVLRGLGYRTAAFHSNPWLSRYCGYNKGFNTFDDDMHVREQESFMRKLKQSANSMTSSTGKFRQVLAGSYAAIKPMNRPYVTAEALNSKAMNWLRVNARDFFLWIHYMDAHEPHLPTGSISSPLRKREVWKLHRLAKQEPSNLSANELNRIVDLYDGEIRYVDRAIGSLFNELKQNNMLNETFVIVTSDHGQQFMEHGDFGHGLHLYDELIRVPLIVVGPQLEHCRIDEQVSLLDLAPTLLDLLGVPKPDTFLGNSLVPFIMGNSKIRVPEAISEEGRSKRSGFDVNTIRSNFNTENRKIALRTNEWKYIYTANGEDELYCLKEDPKEQQNVIGVESSIATEMKDKIMAHLEFEEKSALDQHQMQAKIRRLRRTGKI